MKRVFLAFILLSLVGAAGQTAAAQSPGKILDRYRKAVGGGAVKRIRTTTASGVIGHAGAETARLIFKTMAPDRLVIEVETADFRFSECHNGKSSWVRDSRGLRTLLGQDARSLRLLAILTAGRMRDLARHRIYAQSAATTSIESSPAHAVDFVMNDAKVTVFFDAATYLPIKYERLLRDGVEEIWLSDYRNVEGIMEPFAVRIKTGAAEVKVAVESVGHNRGIDDTAFHYPHIEGGTPLPDVELLMKAVVANQEEVERLTERYTFRQTEVERKLDGDGRVKNSETRVYDVTPVSGRLVRRLVSENGKELSTSEREKEDRRVQKEVEDILKDREKEQAKKDRGEDPDDDRITILTFLRISEVTSVRREVFRDQRVIAFDFEPRKGYKPRNRGESIASKLAGTVWIDEAARQIARLEARFTDSFKIGGGMVAKISPSTNISFEQEKIDGEVWLPASAEFNISARVFLFAKFNRNSSIRYADYRKHKVDSEYKIEKPKEPGTTP